MASTHNKNKNFFVNALHYSADFMKPNHGKDENLALLLHQTWAASHWTPKVFCFLLSSRTFFQSSILPNLVSNSAARASKQIVLTPLSTGFNAVDDDETQSMLDQATNLVSLLSSCITLQFAPEMVVIDFHSDFLKSLLHQLSPHGDMKYKFFGNSLKHFYCYSDSCSDDVLSALQQYCPLLETLNVSNSPKVVKNDSLKIICQMKSLTTLSICNNDDITNVGFACLKNLAPTLTDLNIFFLHRITSPAAGEGIKHLSKLRSLNAGNVEQLTAKDVEEWTTNGELCENLQTLWVQGVVESDPDFYKHIGKFTNLTELDVCYLDFSIEGALLHFKTLHQMKKLAMTFCSGVNDFEFVEVAKCMPKMQEFSAFRCDGLDKKSRAAVCATWKDLRKINALGTTLDPCFADSDGASITMDEVLSFVNHFQKLKVLNMELIPSGIHSREDFVSQVNLQARNGAKEGDDNFLLISPP